MVFVLDKTVNCQSEYCLSRHFFFFNRKQDMSFSEADRMELDSTYSSSRKWDFLLGSFREGRRFDWRSMSIYRFVMTWKKIKLPERPIFNSFFLSFSFRKIEAKQNKSHRMQNTSTSRSTDFRRQKTITSKTPLTLYGRGFCASDGTPTTTGSPAGPQSNQNVWVLPPISRNGRC